MIINTLQQNSTKVKSKSPKKTKKQVTPPTITVRMRVYRDDAERKAKLRLFCESLNMRKEGGEVL